MNMQQVYLICNSLIEEVEGAIVVESKLTINGTRYFKCVIVTNGTEANGAVLSAMRDKFDYNNIISMHTYGAIYEFYVAVPA